MEKTIIEKINECTDRKILFDHERLRQELIVINDRYLIIQIDKASDDIAVPFTDNTATSLGYNSLEDFIMGNRGLKKTLDIFHLNGIDYPKYLLIASNGNFSLRMPNAFD